MIKVYLSLYQGTTGDPALKILPVLSRQFQPRIPRADNHRKPTYQNSVAWPVNEIIFVIGKFIQESFHFRSIDFLNVFL